MRELTADRLVPAEPAKPHIQPDSSIEIVRMLVAAGKRPRVAMVGQSMLPSLHEPMVLALGPAERLRVGDVVAFERGGTIVAHRIVGMGGGRIRTCGDAMTSSGEVLDPQQIIGKMESVHASDAADAARVDDVWFRVRGRLLGRSHALRIFLASFARAMGAAIPWRRQRGYAALLEAMIALEHDNPTALAAALTLANPEALAAAATRHRCAGLLLTGMRRHAVTDPWDGALTASLQRSGTNAVLRSIGLRRQISEVSAALEGREIEFALLKGAARLHVGEADSDLHPTDDIDLLVEAGDLDAAISALNSAGYRALADARQMESYRAGHHHTAPLYPQSPGVPVELHTSLAPHGASSLPSNWSALSPHLRRIAGTAGSRWCLDDFGSALHLALHSMGLRRLRDSVVLANLLRRMSEPARARFAGLIAAERLDPIRLQAAVALAARIGGVEWPAGRAVVQYLDWAARREDLPQRLRRRSQLADDWRADRARMGSAQRAIVPKTRYGVLGRICVAICALAVAALLSTPGRAETIDR